MISFDEDFCYSRWEFESFGKLLDAGFAGTVYIVLCVYGYRRWIRK